MSKEKAVPGSNRTNLAVRIATFAGLLLLTFGDLAYAQRDSEYEYACRDEVSRRLDVRHRDVQTRVGRGDRDRTKAIEWSIGYRGDQRQGECRVDRNLRVIDFWQDGGYRPGGGYPGGGYGGRGRMMWRGRVDNRVEINIRGNRCWTRTLEGAPVYGESYDMSNSMPRNNRRVEVKKRDGRGKVRLIESPNSWNNYTARVEIEDDKGGSDNYEIEVSWD